jgi:hypothetical protein
LKTVAIRTRGLAVENTFGSTGGWQKALEFGVRFVFGLLRKTLHVGFFCAEVQDNAFWGACNVLPVDKPVRKLCVKRGIGV